MNTNAATATLRSEQMTKRVVLVSCKFSRGGFPMERVFHVSTNNGDFAGIAPLDYCFSQDKKSKCPEIERGSRIEGFVKGILFHNGSDSQLVLLPDGEVYTVRPELVKEISEISNVFE